MLVPENSDLCNYCPILITNEQVQIQNFDSDVFSVIFEICQCKNILRQMLVPQTSNLCNCCPIFITNEQVQRQNFDSEPFQDDFCRRKNIFRERLVL
jgi:hypothetical protein